MIENWENNIDDFKKKCRILHDVTKMDVRLMDQDGNVLFHLLDYLIPVTLQSLDKEYPTIIKQLRKGETNRYYYHVNSFNLEYIATGIWIKGECCGAVLMGPFVSSIPGIGFISDIVTKNKAPISERKLLEEFYQSLSVVSRKNAQSIGGLLVNLFAHTYIEAQSLATERVASPLNREELKLAMSESNDQIEERFRLEKEIVDAIAKGNTDEIGRILNDYNKDILLSFFNRIPESTIRSAKNIALVMNTISRTAAERGGVHPLYIHNISEKFAILIERASSLSVLKQLGETMVYEYCTAVRDFSTRHYSLLVKKAVYYIHMHLEEDLSLSIIADEIYVNASHLSRKFKAETNMSIIDYINKKRVAEAKLYLQRGNVSITEVSLMVGFNDLNYFSRVFKKTTSISPSQYSKHYNTNR